METIKELREFILYLETKYNLLDFEIDGVKPWQLMRVHIDYNLGKALGIMESPDAKLNKKEKLKNAWRLLLNAVVYNPFLANKADTVIFSHPRVKKVEHEYIDIYTFYFIKTLRKNTFIEMEAPYKGKHQAPYKKYKYYMDFILICRKLFSRFIPIKNTKKEFIATVESEISRRIGKRYDLYGMLIEYTKMYKVEYFLYKRLLQKVQPSKIYLVVSYSFGALIKAAKDLKIEVIEFQHGNFSQHHFGYYFGEEKRYLDYFPNKFYVWSQYWKEHINFPIENQYIEVHKFMYLEEMKKKYKNIKKEPKQAVVLSQGVLGDKIAQKLYENWDYFQQFQIIYKLHPGEYSRFKSYKTLMELEKKYRIKIVKDVDLYALLAASSYQIGVFSTALYEGIEFECKTILLDLPGIEEMEKFSQTYNVIKK